MQEDENHELNHELIARMSWPWPLGGGGKPDKTSNPEMHANKKIPALFFLII